jgi:hypothetical protein
MVFDRAGKPVENAEIELVAFAHLRANNRPPPDWLPPGGGVYTAILPFEDPGMWEFRLSIKRGPEKFTQIVQREI